MELTMAILKLTLWLRCHLLVNSCRRASRKMKHCTRTLLRNPSLKSSSEPPRPSFPNITKFSLHDNRHSQTLVCDINGGILNPPNHSFFPYFMLVAFEGGSIFRALLLLVSCSFLWLLNHDQQLKVMIFVSFCGLRVKDMDSVSRAVLPKFYLENLNRHVYEALCRVGSKVVFTSVPRVMVEGFLKEYLSVDSVVGTELGTVCGKWYTGWVSGSGLVVKHRSVTEYFGEKRPDIGIGSPSQGDHLFISYCKEAYLVNKEEGKRNTTSSTLPRNKYPKPLIFHDGRLAFLPTPFATLQMFMWVPIGIALAIFRLVIGIVLPYKVAIFLGSLSGVNLTLKGSAPAINYLNSQERKRVLYVCSHRTLLDPVFLSTALGQPLTAVTYSLSRFSEIIAPIKTVRLTRDRVKDSETMARLLSDGDLVVCPEGTTCREPYLLRFSSLFAELADDIVPVAMDTRVTMFYGTTASGFKWLDPIFFLMNPRPSYDVHVLGKLPVEMTCKGGKSSHDVANYIQRQLAGVLGFECTNLTRRDKYLMLAGNEGIVSK